MATNTKMRSVRDAEVAASDTPGDISPGAVAAAPNPVLADAFSLCLETKNFHWRMTGPQFRDCRLMLDEQSDQIFAITDPLAGRVRKLGGLSIHSIGQIARLARVKDDDAAFVAPADMRAELMADNRALATQRRAAHEVCEDHKDVESAGR